MVLRPVSHMAAFWLFGIGVATARDLSLSLPMAETVQLSPTDLVMTGLAVALAIAVGGIFLSARKSRQLAAGRQADLKRLAVMQSELETVQSVLNADPDAVFLWAGAAPVQLFGGSAIIEAGDNARHRAADSPDLFQKFCKTLQGDSADKLIAAVDKLRADGQRFTVPVVSRDMRTLACVGKFTGQGAALWVSDVTEAFEEVSALRRTVDEIRAQRDWAVAILDIAPVPIWRRDAQGKLVWVNNHYVEAVEAKDAATVVNSGEELVEAADVAAAEKQGNRLTVPAVLNGQRRTLEIVERPLSEGSCGFAVDVTELAESRKEADRQLTAQRATLNVINAPLAIFGNDKHLVFCNRAFAEFWGLSEEWLAGNPHHGELLEEMREKRRLPEQADFPAWKKQQLEIYETLIESQEELWHLPDERTLMVISQTRPRGGIIVIYEDLTTILALERSYKALSRVQRESLNNLREGVAVFGVDGRLGLFNPAFLQIWNLREDQLADEPHIDLVSGLCGPHCAEQNIWELLKNRVTGSDEDRSRFEIQTECANGIGLDCSVVPLPDGGTMLTFTDISDTVRIERALRERNDALETADRLKSEFITHISYQLRTPLNTIVGFGEILEHEFFGTLNERQHEYSQGLLEASHHLMELINDVIDLATIEAGHMSLSLSQTNIFALLGSVRDLSRQRAQEADMTLRLDCPEEIGDIHADPRRIKQVMFNLLSNAFKFSQPGDEVIIGANRYHRAEDGQEICQLWVADKGIGIKPEYQQAMFRSFESQPRKGKAQGFGIGLSLVRSLVELHGGWIDVESETDQGATVICNLPVRPAEDIAQKDGVMSDPVEMARQLLPSADVTVDAES